MNVIQKINSTIQQISSGLGLVDVEVQDINVIRQRRAMKVGDLDYVDFALPCFKLAKVLSKNPNNLAQIIIDQLEKKFVGIAKFEAVAGYINVELSHKEIKHLVEKSIHSKLHINANIRSKHNAIFVVLDTDEEFRLLFSNVIETLQTTLDIQKSQWQTIFYDVNADNISLDKFIEKLKNLYPELLVYDNNSLAIYADVNGSSYSIRDVRGRYKSNALLFQAYFDNKDSRILQCFVARQEYIDLVNQLSEFDSKPLNNYYFNPFVVKTDTDEITEKIKDSGSISTSLNELTTHYKNFITDRTSRLELLDLLFFNFDINESLYNLNVPLLFDRINQVLDSIDYLRSVSAAHD